MRWILAVAAGLLAWPMTPALADVPDWARQTAPVPRRALVLGVGTYANVPSLTTPQFDAARVSEVLSGLAFTVTRPTGPMDREAMFRAIDAFVASIEPGDLALIYYSGHGVERDGVNYLIPSDVSRGLTRGREGHQAISLDWLMDEVGRRHAGLSILVLDACRDDPFTAPPGPGVPVGRKGLAPPSDSMTGFFVGFAAAPRASSFSRLDTDPEEVPSIFTRKLVERLVEPRLSLYGVWNKVGRQVYELTGHGQQPWHNASLFPELKLVPGQADIAEERNAWENAVLASTPATLRADLVAFLDVYPASEHAIAARRKIAEIDAGATPVVGERVDALAELAERLGTRPAADLDGVSLTGALTNAVRSNRLSATFGPFGASAGSIALSTAAQTVRASPRTGSRGIGVVATGTPVAVIGSPAGAGRWSKVLLPSGGVGYLQGVGVFRPSSEQVVELSFPVGAVAPGDFAPARQAAAALSGRPGRISIGVGAADGALADRARSLVYLRALALRGELVRAGVAADRIDVAFAPDPAVARDAARLRVRLQ